MAEENQEVAKPKTGRAEKNLIDEFYFGVSERTFTESAWHPDSQMVPYNTDDLYEKANDYSIYEDMLKDDQVDVTMQLKLDLVLGSGWDIVSEKSGTEEMADDIKVMLEEDPAVALDDQLCDLLHNAYVYGFALGEKIFKIKADNTLTWDQVKVRHPATWLIHTDQKGNVKKYEQRGVAGSVFPNPKSLIHYINRPLHQNAYGTSDLRSAHTAWFTKCQIIRYFGRFLEGSAKPIPHASYEPKMPQARVDDMLNILKRFQANTAIVYPKDFEVGFLEAKSQGEAYVKAINMFNMFIGRALFVPDLLGFTGSESSGGGSQALGREQVNIFFKHIQKRRRLIERVVNKNIIQPLVAWNFGNVEMFPKFQLKPITDDDAKDLAKTFIEAMNGRLYKPTPEEINHFRGLIKFPQTDDVEFHEESIPSGGAGGFNPFNPNKPEGPGAPELKQTMPPDDPEAAAKVNKEVSNIDSKKKVELKKGKEYAAFSPPPGKFKDKTNLKAIESALEGGREMFMTDSASVVNDIYEDLIDQIQKKKILGDNPKIGRIDTIKLKKLKQLQLVIKKHLRKAWGDHRTIARQELVKQAFIVNKAEFKVDEVIKETYAAPLESDTFLELLDQESFDFVGRWEFNITEDAKIAMRQAIREGQPLSSVISILDDKSKKAAMVSLERYARTKFTEVMNRARVEEFKDAKVVDGYQYSAVLDGRTTEICRGLHGKQFKKGTEPIPPLHFNCRSILIPITIFEDLEPTKTVGKTPIDQFIKEKSGEGFGPIDA